MESSGDEVGAKPGSYLDNSSNNVSGLTACVSKHRHGETFTYEFENCAPNFGVSLDNKECTKSVRSRAALGNTRISEIQPNSTASLDGRLQIGDKILTINGRDLSKASVERTRLYLSSALRSGRLVIKIFREAMVNGEAHEMSVPGVALLEKKRVAKKIHILKDSRGLGLQISQRMDPNTGAPGIFVSHLNAGGAAARDGRIKEGDELLWINKHSLIGVTQQQAVDFLRSSPRLIQMVLSTEDDGHAVSPTKASKPRASSQDSDRINRKPALNSNHKMSNEALCTGRSENAGKVNSNNKDRPKFTKSSGLPSDSSHPQKSSTSHTTQKSANTTSGEFKIKAKSGGRGAARKSKATGSENERKSEEKRTGNRKEIRAESGNSGKDLPKAVDETSTVKEIKRSPNSKLLQSETEHARKAAQSNGNPRRGSKELGNLETDRRKSEDLKIDDTLKVSKRSLSNGDISNGKVENSVSRKDTVPSPVMSGETKTEQKPKERKNSKSKGSLLRLVKAQSMESLPTKSNENESSTSHGSGGVSRSSSISSTSSQGSKIGTKVKKLLRTLSSDLIYAKADSEPESEPVALEGKSLSRKSSSSSLLNKLKGSAMPVLDASKRKQKKSKPEIEEVSLEPTSSVASETSMTSAPRPKSPTLPPGSAIRPYFGSADSISTQGASTPVVTVGTNNRDSPQASRGSASPGNSARRGSIGKEKEIMTVVLVKGMGGKSLGFTIVGGKGSPRGDLSIYIKSVLPGGAAAADGRLRRGHEVLSVNGTELAGYTHKDALELFKNLRRGIVSLRVRCGALSAPSISTFSTPEGSPAPPRKTSKENNEPTADSSSSGTQDSPTMFRRLRQRKSKKSKLTEVILIKEPEVSLGVGLGSNPPTELANKQGLFIQYLAEGSPAAKDGRLVNGDQLIEVNEHNLTTASIEEAYQILNTLPLGKITLRVLKTDQPTGEPLPSNLNSALEKLDSERNLLDEKMALKTRGAGGSPERAGSRESGESFDDVMSMSSSSEPLLPSGVRPQADKKKDKGSTGVVHPEESSSPPHASTGQRIEMVTLKKLATGELGMGVTIDKSRGSTVVEGVFIKSVAKGKSADQARSVSGGLRAGDEILEVNGTFLKGMDQEDVIKIFRDLPVTTALKVNRAKQPQAEGSTTPEDAPHRKEGGMKPDGGDKKSRRGSGSSSEGNVPEGFKKMKIKIIKQPTASLGLSLVPSFGKLKGLFQVRRILTGSVCDKDGQLQPGDRLISVNGENLRDVSHSCALQILKKPAEQVTFLLLRDVHDEACAKENIAGQNIAVVQVHQPSSSPMIPKLEAPEGRATLGDTGSRESTLNSKQTGRTFPQSGKTTNRNDLECEADQWRPASPLSPPPPAPEPYDSEPEDQPLLEHYQHSTPPPVDAGEENQARENDALIPSGATSASTLDKTTPRRNEAEDGKVKITKHKESLDSDGSDSVFLSSQESKGTTVTFADGSKVAVPLPLVQTRGESSKSRRNSPSKARLALSKHSEPGTRTFPVEQELETTQNEFEAPSTKFAFAAMEDRTRGVNGDKPYTPLVAMEMKDLGSPLSDPKLVKQVMGARHDSEPFIIEFQKRFRSLGIKTSLDDDNRLIVSEVSSFGLVGKDGNIRVGDYLLSINDTKLAGKSIEDVNLMIKNLPKGDIAIEAQAPPPEDEPANQPVVVSFRSNKSSEIKDRPLSVDRVPLLEATSARASLAFSTESLLDPVPTLDILDRSVPLLESLEKTPNEGTLKEHTDGPGKEDIPRLPEGPPPLVAVEIEGCLVIENKGVSNVRTPNENESTPSSRLKRQGRIKEEVIQPEELTTPVECPLAVEETSHITNGSLEHIHTDVSANGFGPSSLPPPPPIPVEFQEDTTPVEDTSTSTSKDNSATKLEYSPPDAIFANAATLSPPSLFGNEADSEEELDDGFGVPPGWDNTPLEGVVAPPPSLFSDDTESLPPAPPPPTSPPPSQQFGAPIRPPSIFSDDHTSTADAPKTKPKLKPKPAVKPKSPSKKPSGPIKMFSLDEHNTSLFKPPTSFDNENSSPKDLKKRSPKTPSPKARRRFREKGHSHSVTEPELDTSLPSTPVPPKALRLLGESQAPPEPDTSLPDVPLSRKALKLLGLSESVDATSSDITPNHGDHSNLVRAHAGTVSKDAGLTSSLSVSSNIDDDMASLPPAPPPPALSPVSSPIHFASDTKREHSNNDSRSSPLSREVINDRVHTLHIPPEDDMASLPPAPPPPTSPIHFLDQYQARSTPIEELSNRSNLQAPENEDDLSSLPPAPPPPTSPVPFLDNPRSTTLPGFPKANDLQPPDKGDDMASLPPAPPPPGKYAWNSSSSLSKTFKIKPDKRSTVDDHPPARSHDNDEAILPPSVPPPSVPLHFYESITSRSTSGVEAPRPELRKKASFDSAMEILDDILPPDLPDEDEEMEHLPAAPPPPKVPPPEILTPPQTSAANSASSSAVSTPRGSPVPSTENGEVKPSTTPSFRDNSGSSNVKFSSFGEASIHSYQSPALPKKPPPPKPRRSFTTTLEDLMCPPGPAPPPNQTQSSLMHCDPIHAAPNPLLLKERPLPDLDSDMEDSPDGAQKTVVLMEPELIADTKKANEKKFHSMPPDVTSVTSSKIPSKNVDWESDLRNFRRMSRMESNKANSMAESSSSSSKDQELDFLNDMMMLEDSISPSLEKSVDEEAGYTSCTDVSSPSASAVVNDSLRFQDDRDHIYDVVERESGTQGSVAIDESGYEDIGRIVSSSSVSRHVTKPTRPPPALPVVDNHKQKRAPSPPVKSPTMSAPNAEGDAKMPSRPTSPPVSIMDTKALSPRSSEAASPSSPTRKHGFPWKKDGKKSKNSEEPESPTKKKQREPSPSKKSGSWKSKLFGSKHKDKDVEKEKDKKSRSRSRSPLKKMTPTSPLHSRDAPSFDNSLQDKGVASPPLPKMKQPLFPVGHKLPPLEGKRPSLDQHHYTKDEESGDIYTAVIRKTRSETDDLHYTSKDDENGDIYTAVMRKPRSQTKGREGRRRSRRNSSPPPPPVPPPLDPIDDDYDSALEYSDGGSWDTSGESDNEASEQKPVQESEPLSSPAYNADFKTELSAKIQSKSFEEHEAKINEQNRTNEAIYENFTAGKKTVELVVEPDTPVQPVLQYVPPEKPIDLPDSSPSKSKPSAPKKPPVPKKPDFLKMKSLPQGKSDTGNTDSSILAGLSYDINKNIHPVHAGEAGVKLNECQTASPPPDLLPVEIPGQRGSTSGEEEDLGPPEFKPPPPPSKAVANELESLLRSRTSSEPDSSKAEGENAHAMYHLDNSSPAEGSSPLPPVLGDLPKADSSGFSTVEAIDNNSYQRAFLECQQIEEPEILPVQAKSEESELFDESYFAEEEAGPSARRTLTPSRESSPFHSPCSSPRLSRSLSFSHNDGSRQTDEPAVKPSRRPPPPMRRRSSSLPQLLPDGMVYQPPEDSNTSLQDLINARNEGANVEEGVITVQLLKEEKSIGLMIIGGLDTPLGMLYIKTIQPGTPADKCGCLRVGDQLLQVNDECLVGVTHAYALDVLKQTPPLVKLTVARKKDREELEVDELGKRKLPDDNKPLFSSAVDSSSVSKTSADVTLSPRSGREVRPRPLSSFGTPLLDDPSYSVLSSSFDSDDLDACTSPDRASPTLNLCQNDVPVTIIDGIPGEASDVEVEVKPSKNVSWAIGDHDSDIFTVELVKDSKGNLGIHVTGGVDTKGEDILVKHVANSSVAAKDGRIKKGDKILSVNGRSAKGMTHSDMQTLLRDVPRRVLLVMSRPRRRSISLSSLNLLRDKSQDKETQDSDAWPTKKDANMKRNGIHASDANPPSLEKIPLDLDRDNANSTYDRFKKKLFPGGNSKTLKEILHKTPTEPSVKEVVLEKGGAGLGFSIGGGRESLYGDTPIYIKYVFKDSVAARSEMKIGDEVLEVNGQSMRGMSNAEAIETIRALPYGNLVIRIRRK